jgi:hypothetical protein
VHLRSPVRARGGPDPAAGRIRDADVSRARCWRGRPRHRLATCGSASQGSGRRGCALHRNAASAKRKMLVGGSGRRTLWACVYFGSGTDPDGEKLRRPPIGLWAADDARGPPPVCRQDPEAHSPSAQHPVRLQECARAKAIQILYAPAALTDGPSLSCQQSFTRLSWTPCSSSQSCTDPLRRHI